MYFRRLRLAAFAGAVALTFPTALPAAGAQQPPPPERDGAHDFDFNIGTWKTHIARLVHPLTGSKEQVELNGTVTVRPIWGGSAQWEEIEADGPNGHWEGMTLFLYDPAGHQWSQTFIDPTEGVFTGTMTGAFENSRGELYSEDTLEGRTVLVRGTWSKITPTSHSYEEAFSLDGGKTWQTRFTANLTKAQ